MGKALKSRFLNFFFNIKAWNLFVLPENKDHFDTKKII